MSVETYSALVYLDFRGLAITVCGPTARTGILTYPLALGLASPNRQGFQAEV
jgi:hypothetical protein